jgi:hypothetical protein
LLLGKKPDFSFNIKPDLSFNIKQDFSFNNICTNSQANQAGLELKRNDRDPVPFVIPIDDPNPIRLRGNPITLNLHSVIESTDIYYNPSKK